MNYSCYYAKWTPTNLLREQVDTLVHPIMSIINMSLKEGIFPSLNKEASVCPIFKKGDKMKWENYRPISLLSNISKLFEKVVYFPVEEFLKSSAILYKYQFGFCRLYKSCTAKYRRTNQILAWQQNVYIRSLRRSGEGLRYRPLQHTFIKIRPLWY